VRKGRVEAGCREARVNSGAGRGAGRCVKRRWRKYGVDTRDNWARRGQAQLLGSLFQRAYSPPRVKTHSSRCLARERHRSCASPSSRKGFTPRSWPLPPSNPSPNVGQVARDIVWERVFASAPAARPEFAPSASPGTQRRKRRNA